MRSGVQFRLKPGDLEGGPLRVVQGLFVEALQTGFKQAMVIELRAKPKIGRTKPDGGAIHEHKLARDRHRPSDAVSRWTPAYKTQSRRLSLQI